MVTPILIGKKALDEMRVLHADMTQKVTGLPDFSSGQPGQTLIYGPDGKLRNANLAAASLPPGSEGQVVGYGPGGEVMPVSSYNDTGIKQRIENVEYQLSDNAALKGRVSNLEVVIASLPPEYDDTELTRRLAAVELDLNSLPPSYDDTSLQTRLESVEDKVRLIPAPYDDSSLTGRITALENQGQSPSITSVEVIGNRLSINMSNGSSFEVDLPASNGVMTDPVVTMTPSISGSPVLGETLDLDVGNASGNPAPVSAIQWLRGSTAISGATGTSYTTTHADAVNDISAQVTWSNTEGSVVTTSNVIRTHDRQVAPTFTIQPALTGSTALGGTITVSLGAASGTPAPTLTGTLTRPGKAPVTVANGATYQIEAADQGGSATLSVTATNSAGTATETATLAVPAAPVPLPRVYISTDLKLDSIEQDDAQSLVHALLCQDKFEIVGIAASPSFTGVQNGRVENIHAILDIYGYDYPALQPQMPTAKTAAALKAISHQGATAVAPSAGWSTPTASSAAIIAAAKSAQTAGVKLNVLTWGGETDLAQALHDDPTIAPHIRFFSIAKQDSKATDYIYNNFLATLDMWVRNQTSFHGTHKTPTSGGSIPNWHNVHAAGHGSLGDAFAYYSLYAYGGVGVKMGDSPTVFRFLWGNQDDPTQPSWGGQFVKSGTVGNYYVDDPDPAQAMSGYAGANTIYIHRDAWLADFQARFDLIQTVATTPKKPLPPTVSVNLDEADLAWNLSASGGSAITDYVIRLDGTVVNDGSGLTRSYKIVDIPNGPHNVTLAAVNALGEGPQSDPVPFEVAVTQTPPPVAEADALRHVWPLDEGGGDTITSENGLAATRGTGATWTVDPARLVFNNTHAKLFPPGNDFALINGQPILVGAVVRFSATNGVRQILTKTNAWQFMCKDGGVFYTFWPSGVSAVHAGFTAQLTAGQWVMLTAYFGNGGGVIRKNGIQLGAPTWGNMAPRSGATDPILLGAGRASDNFEPLKNDDIAAAGFRLSGTADGLPGFEAKLREIAAAKGIALP